MSQYERNLKFLNDRRIIYRRNPTTDKPKAVQYEWGWFYEQGTHQCYHLFASRAKITTYRSLKWHLYVLWYLNPQFDAEDFTEVTRMICDKIYGYVTFNISEQLQQSMIYDVSLMDLEKPPPNKLRKIIFKEYSGLDMRQKLSIVGQMVGRKKLSSTEIYDAMLILNDTGDKITIAKLAKYLKCSTRTIHRNMDEELKREKQLLNQQL